MKNVIRILMERDGLDEEEAQSLIDETIFAIRGAINDDAFEQVDGIMADYSGLDPDYIDELVGLI